VEGDIIVFIPEFSRLGEIQVLTTAPELGIEMKKINQLVCKYYLEVPPPSLQDLLADTDRVQRALRHHNPQIKFTTVALPMIQQLGKILRDANWQATFAISKLLTGSSAEGTYELLAVEPGNTVARNFGLTIDIGTTTVVVYLVDMNNGKVLSVKSAYNNQIKCGEDIITRINYAQEPGGLTRLNKLIISTINELIEKLLADANTVVKPPILQDEIMCIAVAGNTTMIHLFLGINPRYIRIEPYVPTTISPPHVKAKDLGINTNPNAYVYCVPGRSGYVGGDITADILTSNLHKSSELSLLIDVGTNGEVVLGNADWLVACSCSAGPAFEGGEVESGMRAVPGAIERLNFTPELEVEYTTIGNLPPSGICGSGLIDLLAELFEKRVIDRSGRFRDELAEHPRIIQDDVCKKFVLVSKPHVDTCVQRDIVITEVDIRNILRTKAAVYAALTVLLKTMKFTIHDVDRIYISGSFGNYLNVQKAITLGLLPDVPKWKFKFLGNGAIAGALLTMLFEEKRLEANQIYQNMTYIDLSTSKLFMEEFSAALFIPHTNLDLFPSVVL
jgi:uncharacterized 2Fe-2S/4Fe-4S cluster protein (DUF4445 family)